MFREIDEKGFDEAYALLEKSFPLEEYRPYEEQKALLQNPCYRLYAFGEESLEGLFAVYAWEDMRFIEHFAVSPSLRGRGIGARALQAFGALSDKPTYLEVELPERELARRRIAFYERNGFVFNEYPYEQPSISAGRAPVPLRLMSFGKNMTKEEFFWVKARLYREVYRCE